MFKTLNDWMIKSYVGKREDFRQSVDRVLKNERGAGAVEYGLIIAVVVLMVVGATYVMKGPLEDFFNRVVEKIMEFLK